MTDANWGDTFDALLKKEDTPEGAHDYLAPANYLVEQGIVGEDADEAMFLTSEGKKEIDRLAWVNPGLAATINDFVKGMVG